MKRQLLTAQRAKWISRITLAAAVVIGAAFAAQAQNIEFTQGNVGSGLHNTLQIQLKAYPGRGASLPVNLYYSTGGLWRIGHLKTVDQGSYYQPITEAIYGEYSTAGWKSSLDLPIIEWPREYDGYFYSGGPYNFTAYSPSSAFRVRRVYIHMPDGSRHELRENDQPYRGSIDMDGTFHAVDGSRLRYDSTGATTGTLYLPDGSRYELFELNGSAARFIDRNGNTLRYDGAGLWRDTLNRPISRPLSSNPTPGTQEYYLTGMPLPYKFVWKNLSDAGVLTNPSATIKPIANEYLPNPGQEPTNSNGTNYPVTIQSTYGEWPSLFVSDTPDDGALTLVVGRGQEQDEPFDPVVLTEIIYPNGLSYKFSYNIYGEIDKIVYPTGAYEQYTFSQVPDISGSQVPYVEANRAVTKRQLSANGNGNDIAEWTYSVEAFGQDLPPNSMRITTKAPNNTYTEVYRQKLPPPVHGNKPFWAFGFEDGRNGMVFDERIYAPNTDGSKGPMLRRSLTEWQSTTNPVPPRLGVQGETTETAYRNPRPIKTVSLILDTGGSALAKQVTYGYHSNANYALTTGLDRTHMAETHFASIDQPAAQTGPINTISTYTFPPASSSITTYIDDPNYQSRHILGLVTGVELWGPNEQQPSSKSETFYDEVGTFPLIPYSDLAGDQGYNDPGIGTVRGNATTVRRYVDLTPNAETFLETHAQFDQCGNVVNTWNERAIAPFDEQNANSRNAYSAAYRHAYLTQTTSAVPDPSGAHGSNMPFMSASSFDAVTGLVLTVTDINGQTTQFSYSDDQGTPDSLNRLRKVTRPDGGSTKYNFGEEVGNLFTMTETQQDATRTVKSYQYADPMGRASRSFASEGGDSYIASDTIYDSMGRVWKVSNPYRTTTLNGVASLSHSNDWTVSHYDALSRVDYVTLPDASIVQTSYQGIYTTVTDQAGKQRRQKTDALGRVIRVDEPDLSGLGDVDTPTQPTFYEYNTQGNLIHILQGANTATPQHRYFKFDALGRLTYERQVEQVGTHTASDSLTGNSAWSRRLIYDETIDNVNYRGLLTSAYDARNIQTQFRYDNLNRIWQVNYSDGTPTVTNNYDQTRPGFLNRGHLTEALTAAVTDATAPVPPTSQVYNFDLMGRVANNTQGVGDQSYTMRYGYNLGGALTTQTYPSGRVVSYEFDAAARLSQVSSGTTVYANQFDYSTAQGLVKSVTLGNGAVESFTYNSRLQMKSIDLTKSGAQLQHYDYKYGVYDPVANTLDETKNNGQIARIEGLIATQKQWQQNFAYDSLGRLSSAREFRGDNDQQVWLTNHEYDVFGNRFQKQLQNGTNPFTQVWVEDGAFNQSTNRFNSGVTYDAAGNVTVDSKFRNLAFQYDANNRQKQSSATDGSGAVISVYNAGGQRVATQVGGSLTNVLVYDASGKTCCRIRISIGRSERNAVRNG